MKIVNPKVSVILATFNRAHLIGEMLVSILKQSFLDWECLIIDDGSDDTTKEVVWQYIQKDSRFKYFVRPKTHKKGISGSRNFGLDMANGDFIIFYDDDDVSHPKNLEICIKLLLDSSTDFCHYKKKSFSTTAPKYEYLKLPMAQYEIGPRQIELVVTNKIALASCTVMWKKQCFTDIRFNEYLTYAEEWECYTRILLEGYKGIGIDEVLYFNRKHAASNTGEFWEGDKSRRNSYVEAIKLVIKNLKIKNLLSKRLFKYFVQISVFHKNKAILEYLLKISNSSFVNRIKYNFFFKFYPLIIVGHRTKKLIKNKF